LKDRKRREVEISRFPVYGKYKPSRFEWAAHIPATWQEKRAKFVFREIDERSSSGSEELLSVSHYTGVTPRATKDVNMFLAESYEGSKLCKKDDLVINTMWAWMGALGVSNFDGIVSNAYGVYRLQKKSDYHPIYLNYLLRTKYYVGEYIKRSKGIHSSRWRLYPDSFLEISILIPSLAEQTAIVDFLDHKTTLINDFIARKERLIELLQEQKRVIINQAVTRGIDPDVRLKPSGVDWLGDIPDHWEVRPLKHSVTIINGYAFNSSSYVDKGIPIIRIGDIGAEINWDNVKKVAKYLSQTLTQFMIKKGDILLALTGATIGKSSVYNYKKEAFLNQRVGVLRARNINQSFLSYILQSEGFTKSIELLCYGGAQENIGKNEIGSIITTVPPTQEQHAIIAFLENEILTINSLIAKATQEITLIKEYREALIAEAVTGKIDVRGWRKQRGKAA